MRRRKGGRGGADWRGGEGGRDRESQYHACGSLIVTWRARLTDVVVDLACSLAVVRCWRCWSFLLSLKDSAGEPSGARGRVRALVWASCVFRVRSEVLLVPSWLGSSVRKSGWAARMNVLSTEVEVGGGGVSKGGTAADDDGSVSGEAGTGLKRMDP